MLLYTVLNPDDLHPVPLFQVHPEQALYPGMIYQLRQLQSWHHRHSRLCDQIYLHVKKHVPPQFCVDAFSHPERLACLENVCLSHLQEYCNLQEVIHSDDLYQHL